MNHVSPPPHLDSRDAGILVCIDANGDELRLHARNGKLHAHRWRKIFGEWAGPVAYGLTTEEITKAAEVLSALDSANE